MPVYAATVSLRPLEYRRAYDVFRPRYSFQMIWVHAAANAAKMIDLQVVRNAGFVLEFIRCAVSNLAAPICKANAPITELIDLPKPNPAAAIWLR